MKIKDLKAIAMYFHRRRKFAKSVSEITILILIYNFVNPLIAYVEHMIQTQESVQVAM